MEKGNVPCFFSAFSLSKGNRVARVALRLSPGSRLGLGWWPRASPDSCQGLCLLVGSGPKWAPWSSGGGWISCLGCLPLLCFVLR